MNIQEFCRSRNCCPFCKEPLFYSLFFNEDWETVFHTLDPILWTNDWNSQLHLSLYSERIYLGKRRRPKIVSASARCPRSKSPHSQDHYFSLNSTQVEVQLPLISCQIEYSSENMSFQTFEENTNWALNLNYIETKKSYLYHNKKISHIPNPEIWMENPIDRVEKFLLLS